MHGFVINHCLYAKVKKKLPKLNKELVMSRMIRLQQLSRTKPSKWTKMHQNTEPYILTSRRVISDEGERISTKKNLQQMSVKAGKKPRIEVQERALRNHEVYLSRPFG
ncbi:hypothetical protein KC19_10G041600 [Ceratodon purpureus]|uniref:Uncharacterized protein n=1 Tax=Ceratodon purpureus TaxID=3225 RepID=A0A8T0GNL9_CERPU|nr:hypothetical protein KC19_10G041600 [Ceratodon purpureus]